MGEKIPEEIRKNGFSLNSLEERYPEIGLLRNVPQNPKYHGEGDVYRHTKMVCEKMVSLPQWGSLEPEEQELLFLATVFHDMGKRVCTRQEDGEWVSPGHTIAGEKEFRRMVYREPERFGLTFRQRETVAGLIRHHGLPVWFWKRERPEYDLLKAAERIPLRLLYLLSKADVEGRVACDFDQLSENVELFADYAKEQSVWEGAYSFPDAFTKYQYFHKENMWQGAKLYDDTEFDVILMSGLPLSGKDTWIGKYGGEMPVISLDDIREEMGISPAEGSRKVAHVAWERARVLLRRKEPFIWNATNIVRETRQKLVKFFAAYGARVHIVYLEVPYGELLKRNRKRERYIPWKVLEEMTGKLEVPEPWEAYEVRFPLFISKIS